MNEWIVDEKEAGLTALEFLQQRLPDVPRAYLRQLFRAGKVRLTGERVAFDSRLPAGGRLILPDSQRLAELRQKDTKRVEILVETPSILVVFKPAGLAVHRGVGHEEDNLAERVQSLMRQRQERFKISPAHRLDVETSGPVIFGKGVRAVAGLGRQFMERQVEKGYLALVAGEMPPSGLLDSPVPSGAKLKESITAYRTLVAKNGYSLLELQLQTGRTHQIRRQLADAGHPLAGDRRYRGPAPEGLNRLFLHCFRLALHDPFDHSPVNVFSDLPAELAAKLAALGMDGFPPGGTGKRDATEHLSFR